MENVFQDTYASDELENFKPLLQSWLDLNNKYYQAMSEEDVPYYYTEMTNVSHLNAAAWACSQGNWVGLQEYQYVKNTGDKNNSKGFVDLYLYYFTKKIERKYMVEAKYRKVLISDKTIKKLKCNLIKRSKDAYGDIEKNWDNLRFNKDNGADVGLGVTFFDFQGYETSNEIPPGEVVGQIIGKIEDMFTKKDHFHAGAYWFPKKIMLDGSYCYFGTFLAIQKYTK